MTTWEKIIENQMKENEKKILEMYKEALDREWEKMSDQLSTKDEQFEEYLKDTEDMGKAGRENYITEHINACIYLTKNATKDEERKRISDRIEMLKSFRDIEIFSGDNSVKLY